MTSLQIYIAQLKQQKNLTAVEMSKAMTAILQGETTEAELAEFLLALSQKGETASELSASLNVLKQLMLPAPIKPHPQLVDIVGTGGDGANIFNVSTAAAFVIAAAGGIVAKHGNRAASSKSGSADVLLAAGANLDLTPAQTALCVNQLGVGFLFAPVYHSALKQVKAVRSSLGIRTIFNLLGPLANPANVKQQLIGVNHKKWLPIFAQVLKDAASTHALIVHAANGLDEISCCGITDVVELKQGEILAYQIQPEDFGLASQPLDALIVNSAQESLALLQQVFANENAAARTIVALNAGATLYCAGCANSISAGVQLALEVIKSGAAKTKFAEFIKLTQSFSGIA